jgi:DNA-binding MurR/RpiR family transcriptional regulator
VPPAEIERAVAALVGHPRHVVISGGYFSRLLARLLAMQLDQLIPNVDYADEPLGADIGKYLRAGRDSVAIVFDLRRHELSAKEVVSMAKNGGATVFLGAGETALERMADWERSVHIYRAFRAGRPVDLAAADGQDAATQKRQEED